MHKSIGHEVMIGLLIVIALLTIVGLLFNIRSQISSEPTVSKTTLSAETNQPESVTETTGRTNSDALVTEPFTEATVKSPDEFDLGDFILIIGIIILAIAAGLCFAMSIYFLFR